MRARTGWRWIVAAGILLAAVGSPVASTAAASGTSTGDPDWTAVGREAVDLLSRYVRIRSVNPPADTRQTAELLAGLLKSEGIQVKTFEPVPGKVSLLA